MKRGHLKKRIGSLLLALAMIVTSFPVLSTEVQAVEAKTSGTGPSVTAFAEKDQLMTVFKPDENGNSDTIGKLAFGKNEGNEVQNWYILGKDEGVSGDNTVLFAAGPIETGKMFNSGKSDQTYTPAANTGYTDTSSVTVYANHYGASRLYMDLNGMASNYFAGVEQGLMNKTTVKTNDPKNNVDYTTTARLYALTADGTGSYIKAGSRDQIVLAKEKYWNSGSTFWLRAPYTRGEFVLSAKPNRNGVSSDLVDFTNALVPAFSLNLSSVLFASAAEASSSETAVAGTIADGTAMTLRLDGTGKAIGTVIYNEAAGKIEAQKDANATGTVSLVVQGNDGTNDWYYSVQAGETTVVTEEQIKTACSLSGEIDLADCKIWLETPAENGRAAYATKMAKTKKTIDAVALTGVKPSGGSAFPVKTSCGTEGVDANSLAVTYTAKNTSAAATGTADWNTAYQAKLTLAVTGSDSTVYVFGDPVSVTVDGETAQNVKLNDDGTLTVTKDFTTAKRKITGISAPAVPSSKVFADYYTAENVLSNTNRELGKTAMLTLEGNASPNTVNADVAWTLANSGSIAYNAAPGAGNTFRWTIAAVQIKEYDASGCTGYDREAGTISGTVTISNKAATPVTITGDNQTLNFDGSTIDVSKYFTIDTNAGTRSYSLVQDTGVTGEGSLSGAVLTVTKPGVFQVKLTTAANGNYAAGEKTITLTVNYSSGAVTLAPGKTVVHEDETVTNGSDGTVTIDKGNDGTVDVTVKLPQAGTVNIDAEGKVTVPANGTVQATDGKELTLPEGGKVDKAGNVEAAKIVSGDVTVTAPSGGKVTADKAGTITVPEGGTVQSEGGEELTLPAGGTVDKDEKVEAEKITSGETTVTAPAGGKVTADKAGTITVPAGGTVQTGDEEAVTLPGGGTVDTDGTITEWSFEGSGTAENPYQIKTEEDLQELAELVKSGKDPKKAYYKMEAGAGITLTEKSRPWTPIGTAEHPFTGTFDGDGKTIKGLEISGGEPKDNQGLFGVNAGTIENLTVEGSVTGKDNVGGIAGTNTRTGTIKDCTSNVSVTGYNGIGGAAGKNDGTVTGCTNQGSVTGSGTGAGGIAGTNSGTAAGNTNSGSVSGKDSVGGIVGTNGENGKITDNVNSGNVAGDNTGSGSSTIGAVIGKNDNTNLAEDITGNYYQKTDGVNKDLTGIGGTADTAGITSGSSPEPGGTTPGGTTPGETKPGGTTPGETKPGGDKPGTTPEDILSDLTPEQKEKVNQIAKELNVPVETAKKLQEMAQELGIETDTLLLTDKDIVNEDSEEDVKGSAFSKLQAKAVKAKKNSITLKWSKVKGADGYQVYAAKCGKSSRYKLVQTIKKAGATSYTYKKLKKGTAYKFIIKAYKNVDGKKYTIAASKTVHAVTDGGKKTNPKSVKVNKSTVKIRKGKKFTIKPKLVKASSKKKLANHRKIAYESTNKEIATVSKKGVIRGMEKGTCYIYVYAENGIYKKVKVTVK